MISIIIPIYNQREKLGRCLESILSQTEKDIEVIVVNDGSTDKCASVIEEFKEKFRLAEISYKVIEQENKGAPNARNRGFQAAKGDYLFFCDADVALDRDCLREMINALRNHPEAAFAYSSFKFGDKLFRLQEFDADKLRRMPYISSMSLIRTKNFPQAGWDENLKKFQDWDLWLTISEQGGKGIWIDQPLFSACAGGTMSSWLPSFAYKFFPWLPAVKRYNNAARVIKKKHGLLLPAKK
ncbi:MAG TPA: glycosyltransferase family A protein [Candidatus Nanoarchaeia archaeon]|nr:glycosyltransferase family A protein [Candidatus Nanoarchaeia archaeon]